MAAMTGDRTRRWTLASLAPAALGLLLLAAALAMDRGWQWSHFLPTWAWPWSTQLNILLGLRIFVAVLGLAALFLLRPWLMRASAAGRGRQAAISLFTSTLAIMAAFAVTEGILHTRTWTSVQERWDQEPQRVSNAEYGWAFAPDHAGEVELDGRTVHYATGPYGYRAPEAGAGPDFGRPTIVFAGESILFGYGLDWPDTVPAQAERLSGLQAANISVNAHATDQILLRLRRELPRFRRPVAVVIPFMPRLFDRNLDLDRPHLDADLRWHPADPPSLRLVELARRILRYRSAHAIREGTVMTQRALKAEIALAEARGAQAIVLVPQFLPEEPREAAIRRAVLDEAGIPYVLAPVPASRLMPGNHHPDPQGSRAIAAAVVAALKLPEPRLDATDAPI
jgi:hypothetical protein